MSENHHVDVGGLSEESINAVVEDGLNDVVVPSMTWFGSILRSFLLVYVVVLGSVVVSLRTATSFNRLWLVAVLLLPALYHLVMRPLHRRLAIRGLVHRRSNLPTALTAMVSAAVIALAVTVTDGLGQLSSQVAATTVGPVDALVVSPTAKDRVDALAAIERFQTATTDARRSGSLLISEATDGRLLFASTRVFAGTSSSAGTYRIDALEYGIAEASKFGDEPSATGLAGLRELAVNETYIGADLAHDLRVTAGDTVTLATNAKVRRQFTVAGIVPRRGLAALSVDGQPRPRVAIVAPGAVSLAASTEAQAARYFIAYSSIGKTATSWKRSRGLADLLSQALLSSSTSPADSSALTNGDQGMALATPTSGVQVIAVRANLRDALRQSLGPLAPVASGLSGITGVLGAGTLALTVALALRRRRREAHSLRAVGLSRSDAFGVLLAELSVLSFISVLPGAVFGWLTASVVLPRSGSASNAVGTGMIRSASIDFVPHARAVALATAIADAFAVAVVVILTYGFAVTRGWISDGLRDVISPAPRRRFSLVRLQRGLPVALFALGALGVAALIGLGHSSLSPSGFVVAATAVVVSACALTGRHRLLPSVVRAQASAIRQRVSAPILGPVRVAQTRTSAVIRSGFEHFRNRGDDTGSVPVQAEMSAPPALVSAMTKATEDRAPWRTVMLRSLTGGAALVSLMSILVNGSVDHSIADQASRGKGRFASVIFDSNASFAETVRARSDVSQVAEVRLRFGSLAAAGDQPVQVRYSSVDETYSSTPGVARLRERSPDIRTDEAVFGAVLVDPTLAIVNESVFAGKVSLIGSKVFVTDADSGRSGTFVVAGVTRSVAGMGDVIVGPESFDRLRGGGIAEMRHLVSFANGVDAEAGTEQLRLLGARAFQFSEIAKDSLAGARTIARLMRQLAIGAAIASFLSAFFVVASGLRDRRHDVAGLRTLGASNAVIRRVLGTGFRRPAWQGLFVGGVTALFGAWRLIDQLGTGLGFWISVVPTIGAIVALVVGWKLLIAIATRRATAGSPVDILERFMP